MSIKEDNFLTKAISKKISRRSFIKWSSALGATASMSGLVMQAGSKVASAAHGAPAAGVGGSIVEWKPSCCLVCHSWCAIAAGIDANGHVRKVEGCGGQPKNYPGTSTPIKVVPDAAVSPMNAKYDDANHTPTVPGYLAYAPHNKGRICAKGNDGVEHLYDPDRIKYPLKRAGRRGEGRWTRVSWATALGEIADVLRNMAQAGHKHRFVHWVGRNENFSPKNFSKSYGTPNHVEHTSLCELSRHVSGRTLWGHHWSSVDLQEHASITINYPSYAQGGTTVPQTVALDRNHHDIDYYIEWGGNPAEAKIPHSSCATHLGDRRRSNLAGYVDAARDGGGGSTVYGRIACIDVRQSNTAAFADEYFQVIPGSDGAVALYLIYGVIAEVGADTLRRDIERGQDGGTKGLTDLDGGYDATTRMYYGLFAAEEDGAGAASGTAAHSVPAGKSLETYLFSIGATGDQFADHVGSANTRPALRTAVSGISGVSEADLDYLVNVYAYGNEAGSGNDQQFLNVVLDGYRGPCKHTNGVYNYRAIRTLQFLAPNYDAGQFHSTIGSAHTLSVAGRGGYNAPGGFQSDKNWDPYDSSNPKMTGSTSETFTKTIDGALPDDEAVGGSESAPSGHQRLDNWDYENDQTRWRAAYKWIDQNLQCGIRHSLGLNAFTFGGLADVAIEGPYGPSNGNYDPDFKVEAIMWHKNAPTYSRPNQDNEVEMLIAPGDTSTGYALEHVWAVDLNMGDGTRFADIILPDVSYLERYSSRSGEGQEFNYRDNTFWRMPVYELSSPHPVTGAAMPQHMYESKQVGAIYYELARTIETSGAGVGGVAPWNGTLYDSWALSADDQGSVALNNDGTYDHVNDGDWAMTDRFEAKANGAGAGGTAAEATAVGALSGADYVRAHGMMWGADATPAYWPGSFEGDGGEANNGDVYSRDNGFKQKTMGQALQIFNGVLDTTPDLAVGTPTAASKADGTFYGIPVYNEVFLQTSVSYPRHMTTYKLNVHCHARTACMPRLAEIIGNSWAVMPVTGTDGSGPYNLADDGVRKIRNGEVVTVTSEVGDLECIAKVTTKAQANCVHLSHHMGHRAGIYTIDADATFSNPHREAYGTYLVDGAINRDQDTTLNNPSGGPLTSWVNSTVTSPPTAPGKGAHLNQIVVHHRKGVTATGAEYATDPIGASQGWFDTKVTVT